MRPGVAGTFDEPPDGERAMSGKDEKLPSGICPACVGCGFKYPVDAGIACPVCNGTGKAIDPIRQAAEEAVNELGLECGPSHAKWAETIIEKYIRAEVGRERERIFNEIVYTKTKLIEVADQLINKYIRQGG